MRKLLFIIFASFTLILGAAGILVAGHHYHGCSGMMQEDLSSMDTDNDGFVDVDEFTEPHMEKYQGWFRMLDTNKDGFLSQEEWDDFRKVHNFGEKFEG